MFSYFFNRLAHSSKPWIKNDKPWLVIGKGPSFNKVYTTNLSQYYTFGLNHASSELYVDVAHLIDIEVLSEEMVHKSTHILMPWHPHKKCKVMRDDLNQLVLMVGDKRPEFSKLLQEADRQHKLYFYNCSTYKGSPPEKETVKVRYFSGEVPFYILGLLGVKKIYSLGIDGGNKYAYEFQHLQPLENGRANFDAQFIEIRHTCQKFGIEWVRL